MFKESISDFLQKTLIFPLIIFIKKLKFSWKYFDKSKIQVAAFLGFSYIAMHAVSSLLHRKHSLDGL